MSERNLVVTLRGIPAGAPRADDFDVAERPHATAGAGEAVLEAVYISIDPGMRSAMRNPGDPRFIVGEPVLGWGLARVVESRSERVSVGQVVRGRMPWARFSVAGDARLAALTIVDVQPDVPLTGELSALGLPGLVAYVGMQDFGRPAEAESVFVSSAAGAVGGLAGQLARLAGARVIGSTRAAKLGHVRSLGFDDVFDYRAEDPAAALRAWAPDGLQLYFDNVGGAQLQAAFDALAVDGRVVCCGSTSHYDEADGGAFALRGIRRLVTARLSMAGYTIWDHLDRMPQHRADMLAWLRAGDVVDPVTVREGIDAIPDTFVRMLRGEFVGKVMVRVS